MDFVFVKVMASRSIVLKLRDISNFLRTSVIPLVNVKMELVLPMADAFRLTALRPQDIGDLRWTRPC
jgi:hypothetical protein